MRLYLIRHSQPADAHGRCYGREDLPIDPDSLAVAAESIRARICERELKSAEIFTSPLSRCLILAREIAAPREPKIADELLELDFGSWSGKPWESVPRDQLDAWARDVWGYRPGGGESAAMVARRWTRWSTRARRSGAASAIAVTHAGFIRVALACTGRLSAGEFANAPIAFGSVHHLDFDESRVQECAAR
jgi:alpha-ribazole phosphatase